MKTNIIPQIIRLIILMVSLILMDRYYLHTGLKEWMICLIVAGYLLILDKPVRKALDKYFKI